MVVDTLTSTIIVPFAGSGLAGYAMGYALRHVLRWILVAVGIIMGLFLVGIQLLHKWGYVSAVNWDKLGNDTVVQVQHWIGNINLMSDGGHSLLNSLGIPVTSGLALGFIVGFVHR